MAAINQNANGPCFSANFNAVSLTTNPYDMFGILPPSNSRVQIVSILLGLQSTDNTKEQILGVQLLRGSTASSTSAGLTPVNMMGWSGVSAGSSVTQPSSTLVSTASAVGLFQDVWNTRDAWHFPREDCIPSEVLPILDKSQRLHVRITAPSTGTTFSVTGSLQFREIGRPPST